MTETSPIPYSPYRVFNREEWARLRADTPMTIVQKDLDALSGLIEELSIDEIEQIYLPMSRLLNLYVQASQELRAVSSTFLGHRDDKIPFIVGIAGSVAVGKSTTARVLRALLARWPDHPRVDLITTDGFKYYTQVIRQIFGYGCVYDVVMKTRRKDRVVKVDRYRVLGSRWQLEEALLRSEDSSKLNTSFIERLNLTIRHVRA